MSKPTLPQQKDIDVALLKEKSNRLIAEFMGGIFHKKKQHDHSFKIAPNGMPVTHFPDVFFLSVGEMKYDTSWDWLVPRMPKMRRNLR